MNVLSTTLSTALSTAPSARAGPGKIASRLLVGLGLLSTVGCSSYEDTKVAFDSLAGMDPSSLTEPERASYSESALRHGWATEAFSFGSDGVVDVFEAVFGSERSSTTITAPDEFVRDSLSTLVDLSGQDPERLAESAYRVSYVLSKDPRGLSRAIALELSGQILQRLDTEPVMPDAAGLHAAGSEAYLTEARRLHAALKTWWPGIRPDEPMSEEDRRSYLAVLTQLAQLQPGTTEQERKRLQWILELLRLERAEPEIQTRLATLLVESLRSTLLHGIADALSDVDPHVRESAIIQLWRAGGRKLFPWILDRLDPKRVDPMGRVVDASPKVRRRLMQCIWSMDLAASEQRYGQSMSSLEFLHSTATWDPERHLRFLATECLAHLLHRPNEIGSHWVRSWWEEYMSKAKTAEGTQD